MQQIELQNYFGHLGSAFPLLYIEGCLPPPEYKLLTIVGPRKPSAYGIAMTKQIITALSGYPLSIVSGLALGTDALVHESALRANIHTIAIPGSGLSEKVLYPRANLNLAKQIIASGGALLSPWDNQRAAPWTFPSRNQIMAKLSHLVLIIEASLDSGTMITAVAARRNNIALGALPGNIDNLLSVGPNMLIKDGAHCITSANDLLELLHLKKRDNVAAKLTNMDSDHPILSRLKQPMHRDVLMHDLGIASHELNAEISLLEITGLINIDTEGIIRKI